MRAWLQKGTTHFMAFYVSSIEFKEYFFVINCGMIGVFFMKKAYHFHVIFFCLFFFLLSKIAINCQMELIIDFITKGPLFPQIFTFFWCCYHKKHTMWSPEELAKNWSWKFSASYFYMWSKSAVICIHRNFGNINKEEKIWESQKSPISHSNDHRCIVTMWWDNRKISNTRIRKVSQSNYLVLFFILWSFWAWEEIWYIVATEERSCVIFGICPSTEFKCQV